MSVYSSTTNGFTITGTLTIDTIVYRSININSDNKYNSTQYKYC